MNAGFDRHFRKRTPKALRTKFPEHPQRDAATGGYKSLQPAALCAMFSDDMVEEYAMGMQSEEDCTYLEQHLLICSTCQDRLAEMDEYIKAAKAAAALLSPQNTGTQTRRRMSKPVAAATSA